MANGWTWQVNSIIWQCEYWGNLLKRIAIDNIRKKGIWGKLLRSGHRTIDTRPKENKDVTAKETDSGKRINTVIGSFCAASNNVEICGLERGVNFGVSGVGDGSYRDESGNIEIRHIRAVDIIG